MAKENKIENVQTVEQNGKSRTQVIYSRPKDANDVKKERSDASSWLSDNGLSSSWRDYGRYHNQIVSMIPNWDKLSPEQKQRYLNSPAWAQLRNFSYNSWNPNKSEKEIQQLLGQIASDFDKITQETKAFEESTPEKDALRKLAAGYNTPLSDASSASSASVPTDGIPNAPLTDPSTEFGPLDFADKVGQVVSSIGGVINTCLGFSKQIKELDSLDIKNQVESYDVLKQIVSGYKGGKQSPEQLLELAKGMHPHLAKYFKNIPNSYVEEALRSQDGVNNLMMAVGLSNVLRFTAMDEKFIDNVVNSDFMKQIGDYYIRDFEYRTKRSVFENKYNAEYFEKADGKTAGESFNAKNIFDRDFWKNRKGESAAAALNELDELTKLSAGNQQTMQAEMLGSLTAMLNSDNGLERVFAMLMLPICNTLMNSKLSF